ncbi:SDR family NAD(P)-dependent oxidoreductase [Gordonia humi]|uniref:NAD(P)-dependent dehydrogenase (Short-subunit alcohol dehydrogenase family) n=1 Tax=Gordonia humi TaxID=686429 RepID=A0A840F1N8_9ACTN|nr:SDR family oxidoreductase [Gordonia humi]MBB4134250.1 NAD(P)-dependent dehydrogenase (short-subunit alcohol dehydrogenase family) [Gordonia humi]
MEFSSEAVARDLTGQWCVVTGGSDGIGYAIAERFVAAGAHVLIAARGAEKLDAARIRLDARSDGSQKVLAHRTDAGDRESIAGLFARIDELDALNVFVANAGSGSIEPFLELDVVVWDRTIGLNLTGTFTCVQSAARRMVAAGEGNRSIIAISSIRGLGARPGTAHYAASKAGLNQMMRVAAYELAEHRVRANVLSPGITQTSLSDGNPEVRTRMVEHVPMSRAGSTEDMAAGAHYLASPSSGFVTGTNVVIDGGESLW